MDDVSNAKMEPTPPPQLVVKKSSNAPLVGAIVFLALAIAAAAIYLGLQGKEDANSTLVPPISPTPIQNEALPSLTPSPSLELLNWETANIAKMKDLAFPGFSIQYPSTWMAKETKDELTQTVTISNDGNEIVIHQGPMGGNMCIFEGEMPDGPANDYRGEEYISIKAESLEFRRIVPEDKPGKTTHSLCSNSANSPTTFAVPTSIGVVTYSQNTENSELLLEMDKILSTIKIQE